MSTEEQTYFIYRVRFLGIAEMATGIILLAISLLNVRSQALYGNDGHDLATLYKLAIPLIALGACLYFFANRIFALLFSIPLALSGIALAIGSIQAGSLPGALGSIAIGILLMIPIYWTIKAWPYLKTCCRT